MQRSATPRKTGVPKLRTHTVQRIITKSHLLPQEVTFETVSPFTFWARASMGALHITLGLLAPWDAAHR